MLCLLTLDNMIRRERKAERVERDG
jgi:hypothetical protein